jgi:hypothetical protein
MTGKWMNRIQESLWPRGSGRDVWMIIDAARDPRISGMLATTYLEHACLFSGSLAPELKAVAPYLLHLEYNDRRTERYIDLAWGNSWGVFLRCDTSLDRLRRHLRGLLTVRDPSGNRLMFRYYDPRVLRVYLPTCTPGELRTVFGPVERLWTEDERSGRMLEFSFDETKLAGREIPLDT